MSINIPVRMRSRLLRQTCTISRPVVTIAGDGAPNSTQTDTTATGVACFLAVASSNDQILYGGETNITVFNLHLAPGTVVRKTDTVNIDGLAYEVVAAGVDPASAGTLILAKVRRQA